MVSPELIRRYPFFAGLEHTHIVELAKAAEELTFEADATIFAESASLGKFYLLLEGAVAIVMEVPDRSVEQDVSGQLTGQMVMKDVVLSTVGTGSVFGWPGLVPPHSASAGAKAITSCKVVGFNAKALLAAFEDDPTFGYLMTQKAAGIIAERLRDMQIESLASLAE